MGNTYINLIPVALCAFTPLLIAIGYNFFSNAKKPGKRLVTYIVIVVMFHITMVIWSFKIKEKTIINLSAENEYLKNELVAKLSIIIDEKIPSTEINIIKELKKTNTKIGIRLTKVENLIGDVLSIAEIIKQYNVSIRASTDIQMSDINKIVNDLHLIKAQVNVNDKLSHSIAVTFEEWDTNEKEVTLPLVQGLYWYSVWETMGGNEREEPALKALQYFNEAVEKNKELKGFFGTYSTKREKLIQDYIESLNMNT